MRYVRTFTTRATPQAVIEYVADFSRIPEWDHSVISCVRDQQGPIGLGSSFSLKLRFAGSIVAMNYAITELQPGRHVQLTGRGEGSLSIDDIDAEACAEGSHVRYQAVIGLPGALKLLTPLLWVVFLPTVKRAASGLKTRLDAIAAEAPPA